MGDIKEFFIKQYPEIMLNNPVMNRLRSLINAIQNEIKQKSASRELSHLYTNILACIVNSKANSAKVFKHEDFTGAG